MRVVIEIDVEAVPRMRDCVRTLPAGEIATASKRESSAMHEAWQASPAKA